MFASFVKLFATIALATSMVGLPTEASAYQYIRLEVDTSYEDNATLECIRDGDDQWNCTYRQLIDSKGAYEEEGENGSYNVRYYGRTDIQRIVIDDAGMQELIDQLHNGTLGDVVVDFKYVLRE